MIFFSLSNNVIAYHLCSTSFRISTGGDGRIRKYSSSVVQNQVPPSFSSLKFSSNNDHIAPYSQISVHPTIHPFGTIQHPILSLFLSQSSLPDDPSFTSNSANSSAVRSRIESDEGCQTTTQKEECADLQTDVETSFGEETFFDLIIGHNFNSLADEVEEVGGDPFFLTDYDDDAGTIDWD